MYTFLIYPNLPKCISSYIKINEIQILNYIICFSVHLLYLDVLIHKIFQKTNFLSDQKVHGRQKRISLPFDEEIVIC